MKKVLVIALMLGAGLAYAGSLAVPWFVDNAATGSNPPALNGTVGGIYLNNTSTEVLEVTVAYFTATGVPIGPWTYNTFVISPNASLGYRPVADDSAFESVEARKIPNRPLGTLDGNDNKKNGSCTFTWAEPVGGGGLVGSFWASATGTHATSSTDPTPVYMLYGYGHLLPSL